jgi:hypothetical protein
MAAVRHDPLPHQQIEPHALRDAQNDLRTDC